MCIFATLIIWELHFKVQTSLRHKISCPFSPSPSTHLLLPSSSYPWLPMVVSFFLTHLLLEVAPPIIFLLLHSTAIEIQEAKDSIDEKDPRPTSSTWSYISPHTIMSLIRNSYRIYSNTGNYKKLQKIYTFIFFIIT